MEGQPSSANSQYQYQSAQWSKFLRRKTLADIPSSLSPRITSTTSQVPAQIDLLSSILPPQSSYQLQLAQYNKIISSGRDSRLQAPPLPPLLSAPHIQAVPGSRPGSSGGNTARNNKSSGRGGHGNKETRKFSPGERALMTERHNPTTMPARQFDADLKLPAIRPLPQHQNSNVSHQSNSMPSTPHTHARQCSEFSFESREPSPTARINHSPRSAYSESNITLPSRHIPPLKAGCRYETFVLQQRRRIAYPVGEPELRLPRLNDADVKSQLTEDEERKLTTDMRELYDKLKPTAENDRRRKRLVERLEHLFIEEWPGNDIRVHVFGSSGNLLCTDQSDVDLCITTNSKDLKDVHMIAELLGRSGMKDIICVPNAKIPIVKMVDPETELLCDMNINSTDALENTRLIKTYVEIDPRVRPLAMIIKHWTKRRIINDAGSGGTLSSYTWINMIINFLQTRKPPILPSLHQRLHMKLPSTNGKDSPFADDLGALRGFGKKNEESLGQLLFGFFRFFGHEFDYDKSVISVRGGKQISKIEKNWSGGLESPREICVEEPFNTNRNLANTADQYTVQGLHTEIRRAFDLVCEAKLDELCEQWEWPSRPERPRNTYQKAAQKAVPIRSASQSQPSRGGGRGGRGNRHHNHGRNANGGRRSSAGPYDHNLAYLPMSANDSSWLQQQTQATGNISDHLRHAYTVLQAEENSLRLQLYTQSQQFLHAQMHAQNQAQGYGQPQARSVNGSIHSHTTDRNRTNSFDLPQLQPQQPLYYYHPIQSPASMYAYQTSSTNPSSPSMSSTQPERRGVHRSSITNGSAGLTSSSLRSHSQPAVTRSGPSPLSTQGNGVPAELPNGMSNGTPNGGLGIYPSYRQQNGSIVPLFPSDESSLDGTAYETSSEILSHTGPEEIITPRKYAGYFVSPAPSASVNRQAMAPLAIPSFGDMHQSRRRQSTDHLPPSVAATLNRMQQHSRSPSPLGNDRTGFSDTYSAPMTAVSSQQGISTSNLRALNSQAPVLAAVVNGSTSSPISIPQWRASVSHGSEDRGIESEAFQTTGIVNNRASHEDLSSQSTPREIHTGPMVVNGSTPVMTTEPFPPLSSPPIVNGAIGYPYNSTPNGLSLTEHVNGVPPPRMSPNAKRAARPVPTGGMSPLEFGLHEGRDDARHLSPVLETRTPSPTVNRKFEPGLDRKSSVISVVMRDEKPESSKTPSKLGHPNGNQLKNSTLSPKAIGHTRNSKSEGTGSGTGWTPVSRKKGSVRGPAQAEKPPKNDSERRGG